MSLFTKKLNEDNNDKINYKPSEGWVEARIIGLADLGEQENKTTGKMQPKMSVLFAIDEMLDLSEPKPKTHTEKFTVSLDEKSNLVKKYLAPSGLGIESLDELIGKPLKLKFKASDCGKYMNVANVDESDAPLAAVKDVYVPKWWIQDKDAKETGYDLMVEAGVIETLMPKTEKTGEAIYN